MSKSKIDWTDDSCNFTFGCQKVSEGCENCYALRRAYRLAHIQATAKRYEGVVEKVGGRLRWTGRINVELEPLRRAVKPKSGRRIFVGSMSDIFHDEVLTTRLFEALQIMINAPQHSYLILTKRPANMSRICKIALTYEQLIDAKKGIYDRAYNLIKHCVWIGVSVENQHWADIRIPQLIENWPGHKFVSLEPLLGPVILRKEWLKAFDWVIVGCESGPGARPTRLDWVRSLRDQCIAAGVPFFVKQLYCKPSHISEWPEYLPSEDGTGEIVHTPPIETDGKVWTQVPKAMRSRS